MNGGEACRIEAFRCAQRPCVSLSYCEGSICFLAEPSTDSYRLIVIALICKYKASLARCPFTYSCNTDTDGTTHCLSRSVITPTASFAKLRSYHCSHARSLTNIALARPRSSALTIHSSSDMLLARLDSSSSHSSSSIFMTRHICVHLAN